MITWLLDIDGVVNADRPRWAKATSARVTAHDGVTYTIRWAPELVGGIRDLVARHGIDLLLCSTWCDDADLICGVLGLPMRPAFTGLTGKYSADAKHAAARAALDAGGHLVWADDREIPEGWSHPRALPVRPKSWGGLTRKDLMVIDDWCASVQRVKEATG